MAEQELIHVEQVCYHCGDGVEEENSYILDNHSFCCLGCQTVYQVLKHNDMQSYYRYNTHPGKSQKGSQKDLSYLEEGSIVAKLVDFKDTDISIITFYIPAIHCSSCIWLLEHLYKLDHSVVSSTVDFMKKQASITFKHNRLSLKSLVELLIKIGYEPKITLQDVVKEGLKQNNNQLVAKIAVAGFCFGNSMMLSFPEYFGMDAFEKHYANFFGYMNLGFTIPTLLYSAADYFRSAWQSIRQKQLNLDVPLALGIFVIFLRTAVEVLTHSGPGFADTLCSLVFFILIGKWVQQRTYYHLSFERDYRSYFPVAVTVISDEFTERPVQIAALQVGDRIRVRNNEIIPADAILLKGRASVDFSFVTGEAKAVDKSLGEIVYAGGRQMGEAIELEVVKPVSQSYLTKLWNNESFKQYEKKFDTFIGFISKYFTVALVAIALLATTFWLLNEDNGRAWGAFTAVLIIACPCALALSSPFTLSAALSILDRNKMYVKNAAAVEQMAAIDCLVFDKTGTISSPTSSSIVFDGVLTHEDRVIVNSLCRHSSHPLSREIVKWLAEPASRDVMAFREIVGKGMEAEINGRFTRVGSASFVGKQQERADGTMVFVAIDHQVKGCFSVEQSWRSGLTDIIREMRGKYALHLLSGDNERRKDALGVIFPSDAQLVFNQAPLDKLHKIEAWQEQGLQVCMLGDGLNDAGALRKADLGIAVSDDINNFSPGCDAILDGASFQKLPQFFGFAKDAVKVIHLSFAISLLYNVVGLTFAVQGVMSPLFAAILMPISTVTIISFTSLATRWYARLRGLL
ncbi:heavy metal translocating P-type ATPase metal-binding domain-containing protein [Sphingobacterium oryzagri]|uniref:Heavy metal translocating P-type ATPase metal-binding domain-containing protein n=1 Tax=Sphingobacterium oryzagri TaxID=3025669 RepID=A0ABY7WDN6_9SPHI|nr:heavy metal translocating P-type ATPase metal-binding domain-containing protein [Sphingobacterium sp. KACC 22765]WDF67761.1 heavy metal translocating P-type ATPase metal-binding domain-containing protein [Sphingobacterium sp. KACC 22765]